MSKTSTPKSVDRVAIVSGLRTPFQRIATGFRQTPARILAARVLQELIQRSGVPAKDIDQIVLGQVIMSPSAPNVAREAALAASLPFSCDAYSVSRACASSYQSVINVAEAIQSGQIDIGIAGGVDVSSQSAISLNQKMTEAMVKSSYAKSFADKLRAFKGVSFKDLMPSAPALREPSSRYTMGEAAEKMAKMNAIARQDQDALAHQSHINASRAWQEGWFDDQVMDVVLPPQYQAVSQDNLVRGDSVLEKYARLKPVFDRQYGSVTAANSSPLTDGASAVLMMKESRAKALGLEPLGLIQSYAFTATDPNWQMLIGPAFATPKALDRAGMSLSDIDIIDMHEAFAAQVLSNIKSLQSKQFAQQHLNRSDAVGEVDMDNFNISGSSISIGHPFAATGTRQLTQILHDMKRTDKHTGLITACASGGLGAAIIVQRT